MSTGSPNLIAESFFDDFGKAAVKSAQALPKFGLAVGAAAVKIHDVATRKQLVTAANQIKDHAPIVAKDSYAFFSWATIGSAVSTVVAIAANVPEIAAPIISTAIEVVQPFAELGDTYHTEMAVMSGALVAAIPTTATTTAFAAQCLKAAGYADPSPDLVSKAIVYSQAASLTLTAVSTLTTVAAYGAASYLAYKLAQNVSTAPTNKPS